MGITPFHGPPADPPVVPGFVATTLLGFGAHGAVWSAREQITGDAVALKVGRRREGTGPGAGSAEREADLLSRLDHPHLIRLRRVVTTPDGALALVLDLATGGSLAALVAARGQLTPGEVVTMVLPLADALAELHRQGMVHGDVAPGNVLFSAEGKPLLGDLGVSGVLSLRPMREWATPGFSDPALPATGDEIAADVWSLGAVAWFALTGEPPPVPLRPAATDAPVALMDLLADCLAADPARRPSLAEVAERVWEAGPAVPISLLPHATGPVGDDAALLAWPDPDPALRLTTAPSADVLNGHGDRTGIARPTRRHLVAAVLGCLVAGAVTVSALLVSGSGSSATSGPGADVRASAVSAPVSAPDASPVAATEDQRVAMDALSRISRARAAAFAQVSVAPLADADEPGSAAGRLDARLVRSLAAARVRLDGVSYVIRAVEATPAGDGLLDVSALVTTSAHRQVSTATGAGVRDIAAVGPERVRLRLVRHGQDWKVRTVQAGR